VRDAPELVAAELEHLHRHESAAKLRADLLEDVVAGVKDLDGHQLCRRRRKEGEEVVGEVGVPGAVVGRRGESSQGQLEQRSSSNLRLSHAHERRESVELVREAAQLVVLDLELGELAEALEGPRHHLVDDVVDAVQELQVAHLADRGWDAGDAVVGEPSSGWSGVGSE